jgi:CRP/FNR family transcriptional activator FtrB
VKGVNGSVTTDTLIDADACTQTARSGFGKGQVEPTELRAIPLFAQVAENDLAELAAAASERRYSARARFIRDGGQCHALHVIMEGTAEVFSGSADEEAEAVIEIAQPGAVLLLTSVMTGCAYAASARTLSPARIVTIPATAIRELFDRDGAFARALVGELSRTSCRMLAELRSLKTRTSTERLLNWLLSAAQSNGSHHLKLPFGKRTLASLLGMTPECLSRSFRSLAKQGIVVRGRDVSFADRSGLAKAISSSAKASMDEPILPPTA